jgi:hypothetical protein
MSPHLQASLWSTVTDDQSIDNVDPEEYVQNHRERLLAVIRQSSDPFARACAWMLLDRFTEDRDFDELIEELRAVTEQDESE